MPRTQTGVEDLAEVTARRRCRRCDHNGLVWFRPDGVQTVGDDPHAVRAARCRHPRPASLAPYSPDDAGEDLDDLYP